MSLAMPSTSLPALAPSGPGPRSRTTGGGTAEYVAEFLTNYIAVGCAEFNLIPQSPGPSQAIARVAAVKKLLAQT
jgi:hypothetical protein